MALDHAALENLWIVNGGNPLHADVAAAIAQAESGGCQYAKAGPTDDRPVAQCSYRQTGLENSYGLWQVNRDAHPQYSAASLYTLAGNARAAIAISGNGANFQPWTTFVLGAYVQYLSGAPGGPQPGPTVGVSGSYAVAPRGHRGWADLRNTISRHLPTQTQQTAYVTRQASQRLNHVARNFLRG